jgi:hypothetical protein
LKALLLQSEQCIAALFCPVSAFVPFTVIVGQPSCQSCLVAIGHTQYANQLFKSGDPFSTAIQPFWNSVIMPAGVIAFQCRWQEPTGNSLTQFPVYFQNLKKRDSPIKSVITTLTAL